MPLLTAVLRLFTPLVQEFCHQKHTGVWEQRLQWMLHPEVRLNPTCDSVGVSSLHPLGASHSHVGTSLCAMMSQHSETGGSRKSLPCGHGLCDGLWNKCSFSRDTRSATLGSASLMQDSCLSTEQVHMPFPGWRTRGSPCWKPHSLAFDKLIQMGKKLPFSIPKEIPIVRIKCHTQGPNFCPQKMRRENTFNPVASANAQRPRGPLHPPSR